MQIELVVLLRIPPLPGRHHRSRDGPLPIPPLALGKPQDTIGLLRLLVRMREDGRAVLRAPVLALGVERRGVVHLEEELDEFFVAQFFWVVEELDCFCVCSPVQHPSHRA